jgi:hypothetical protein
VPTHGRQHRLFPILRGPAVFGPGSVLDDVS